MEQASNKAIIFRESEEALEEIGDCQVIFWNQTDRGHSPQRRVVEVGHHLK